MKKMVKFLVLIALFYYILPLIIIDTGSGMLVLLVLFPVITLISSIFYGVSNGGSILFAVLVGILFFPTIFIFYNISAWIYIFIYMIVALVGTFIGKFL